MIRKKIKTWAILKVALIILSFSTIIFFSVSGPVSALSLENRTVATTDAPGINCSVDFNPLTWLICPIIDGMSGLITGLDDYISNLLNIDTCTYFNSSSSPDHFSNCPTPSSANDQTSNGFYSAWSELRDIALGLMVIGSLVMIISQIMGFEFLDAYTVKKVLPRLLVAAIGISLSWELVQFLVQVANDLGNGISYLIYEPFKQVTSSGVKISQNTSSAGTVIAFGALYSAGIIGELTFVLVAAVAVLLGFVIIVLRSILIVFLAILVPVAIAMFILPNTSKVWKLWWTTFSKALLMFPLIAGMIAVGRVFASISSASGSLVGQFVAFIAYFGPYFIIPQTFKFAGGILAMAGNAAGNIQKGVSKSMATKRQSERKRLKELGERGERFRKGKQTGIAGFANRRTIGLSTGVRGRFGIGQRGKSAINQAQRERDNANMANNKGLEDLSQSSDAGNAIMARSGGTEAGGREARSELKELMKNNLIKSKMKSNPNLSLADATSQAEEEAESATSRGFLQARAVGFTTSNARAAINTAAKNKWRALGGGADAKKFITTALDRAYSGASSDMREQAMQTQAYIARTNGRTDVGGVKNGKLDSADGMSKVGAYATARDYTDSLETQTDRIVGNLNDGASSVDDKLEAAAQLAALRSAMGQDLSEGNKRVLNEAFTAAGLDIKQPDIIAQLAGKIAGRGAEKATIEGLTNQIRHKIGSYDASLAERATQKPLENT